MGSFGFQELLVSIVISVGLVPLIVWWVIYRPSRLRRLILLRIEANTQRRWTASGVFKAVAILWLVLIVTGLVLTASSYLPLLVGPFFQVLTLLATFGSLAWWFFDAILSRTRWIRSVFIGVQQTEIWFARQRVWTPGVLAVAIVVSVGVDTCFLLVFLASRALVAAQPPGSLANSVGPGLLSALACWVLTIPLEIVSLLAVLRLHLQPDGDRTRKYYWLVTALGLKPDIPGVGFALALWLLVSLIRGRLPGTYEGSTAPLKRERIRWIRRFGSLAAILSLLPVVPLNRLLVMPYMFFRYYLIQCTAHHPILYLRAFGYVDGPLVFARVVAPSAGRFGAVWALTHQRQQPSTLLRYASGSDVALMVTSEEHEWKNTVIETMSRCYGVILDLTGPGEGLRWELETARGIVPSGRILCLRRRGDSSINSTEETCVEYDLGKQSRSITRRCISDWLENINRVS